VLEPKLPLALMLLLLLGCGANPVEKDLSIRVSDQALPLKISTSCEDPSCAELQQLHTEIVYAAGLPQTETVELDEYRVDYDLDGVKGPVPYFAAKKKLLLSPGESASLSLDISGSSQRSYLIKKLGHASASGIGRLTFAGYDHDNHQILAKSQFEVEVGEIDLGGAMGTTSPPMTMPTQPQTSPGDAGTTRTGVPDAGY